MNRLIRKITAIAIVVTVAGFAGYTVGFLRGGTDYIPGRWCTGDFADIGIWGCLRAWQTALGAGIALLAALVTGGLLWVQIRQVKKNREEDRRRDTAAVADIILSDLLHTMRRITNTEIRDISVVKLSGVARKLLPQTPIIAPELALALVGHCNEVEDFTAQAKRRPLSNGQIRQQLEAKRAPLAYRAEVLSRCFGSASEMIKKSKNGQAKGPFLTRKAFDEIGEKYITEHRELDYLQALFDYTGFLAE